MREEGQYETFNHINAKTLEEASEILTAAGPV